jgi:hypothetical protein
MLLNASGVPYVSLPPTPSAEQERQLRDVLRSMDPLLDVMWHPTIYWNASQLRWEGRYALTCRWPMADLRWRMVQSGEVPETDAYDIVGWLCTDMSDPQSVPISADGIADRVLQLLGSMDNTRYPWKQRMLATIEKNRKRQQTMKDEALDMTHDAASYYRRQALGVPQSRGANFDKEGRLVQ